MSENKVLSPVVKILTGSIQGIVSKSRDGREFYEYKGIPYAKPPIGELRFEPPQPAEKWEGVRDASTYGNVSVQFDPMARKIVGEEDCLFLNVFTPKPVYHDQYLPVLVWIHGGMWISGSSNKFGANYFMDHDVILVTINYRVGVLGFLNTGDEIVRGNMGLKDQVFALKWVQANIHKFGGNAQRVTICGQSAGGASVHHLVLSPLANGLFHRAISQSGTAVPNWSARFNAAEQAKWFAKDFVGCPIEDTKAMVDYYRSVDAIKLIEASMPYFRNPPRDPMSSFNPTIETIADENAFLTEHPTEILRKGCFNKIPWMTGVNDEDGLACTLPLQSRISSEVSPNYERYIPNMLWHEGPPNMDKVKRLFEFYVGDEKDPTKEFEKWTNMMTDTEFGTPAQKSLSLQSQHAQVFAYYYTYQGEFTLTAVFRPSKGRLLVPSGACHFDECALLFSLEPMNYFIKSTDKDYQMSKNLVSTWVSFASETDLKNLKFCDVIWPVANVEAGQPLKYMHLDKKPSVINEPNPERNAFWNNMDGIGF